MKTSIWVETLDGHFVEIFNTAESIFETVESSRLNVERLNC